MASKNVDINLLVKQAGTTESTLNKVIKKLKEIETLSKKGVGGTSKNPEAVKQANLVLQNLKLQQKEVENLNKGRSKSLEYVRYYSKLSKAGLTITTEQWEKLKLVNKEESKRLEITKNVNKNVKAQATEQYNASKKHYEALKMNQAFDAKASASKVASDKTHYLALKQNQDVDAKIIQSEKVKTQLIRDQQSWLTKQLITVEKIGNYSGYENLKKTTRNLLLQLDARKSLTKEQKTQFEIEKALLSLNKQTANESASKFKLEKNNLNSLNDIRNKVNASELSEKKKYNTLLNDLSKKSTAENFKRELSAINALFNEERKKILSLSDLNAKKNSEYLNKNLANLKPSSFSFGGDASKDSLRINETLSKAREKGWVKSIALANKYKKLMQDQFIISDKQWSKLKRTSAFEENNIKTIQKQASIKSATSAREIKEHQTKLKLLEKQKFLMDKMSVGIKGKAGYDTLTTSLTRYQARVKSGIALTSKEVNSLKLLRAQTRTNTLGMGGLAKSYLLVASARRFMRSVGKEITFLAQLDQSIYNLGVVAGKTTDEIEVMKSEFLKLGSELPQSAIELSNSTDILARSGLTYSSAIETMKAGATLATASGESVASTSRINCSRKNLLIDGKAYIISYTKLRQKCA